MFRHPVPHHHVGHTLVDLVEACGAPSVDDAAKLLQMSSREAAEKHLRGLQTRPFTETSLLLDVCSLKQSVYHAK